MTNLCIKDGSLNEKERKIIQNHVNVTIKILNELPFPRKLENVPEYAGGHHEKLNDPAIQEDFRKVNSHCSPALWRLPIFSKP